jgi:hypothetical protein
MLIMVNSSLRRPVVKPLLFPGHLANYYDQQNHDHYADHGPNPHSSASHPAIHPSVCVIHQKVPFVGFAGSSSAVAAVGSHEAIVRVRARLVRMRRLAFVCFFMFCCSLFVVGCWRPADSVSVKNGFTAIRTDAETQL